VTDSETTGIVWRKSTASDSGQCVEVAFIDESVLVRNSKTPSGPILCFSRHEWAAFLGNVTNGQFAS
jgi:Domain of unknown function (DUF397)